MSETKRPAGVVVSHRLNDTDMRQTGMQARRQNPCACLNIGRIVSAGIFPLRGNSARNRKCQESPCTGVAAQTELGRSFSPIRKDGFLLYIFQTDFILLVRNFYRP